MKLNIKIKLILFVTFLFFIGCMQNDKKEIKTIEIKYSKKDIKNLSLEENNNRIIFKNNNFFLLKENLNKEIILDKNYQNVFFYKNNIMVEKMNKYNLINDNGVEIFTEFYDDIKEIDKNLYAVSKDKKYALRTDSVLLTDYIYDKIVETQNELIIVIKNKKIGVIDRLGNEVLMTEYISMTNFSENIAIVVSNDLKTGYYIDKNGQRITQENFNYLLSFENGKAIVSKNGKFGVINNLGVPTIPYEYNFLRKLDNELFVGTRKDQNYLIDSNNNKITNTKFEIISELKENVILAKKNGKFGYIDKKGNDIIPFEYSEAGNFENGLAIVQSDKNKKYGIINKKNKFIFQPKATYISARNQNYFVIGDDDGLESIININGKNIMNKNYQNVVLNSNNTAFVKIEDKEFFITLDNKKEYDITNKEIVAMDDNELILLDKEYYTIIKIKE